MIPQLIDRAQILNKHADAEWFRPTIEALTRVVNISKKYEDGVEVIRAYLKMNTSKPYLIN